MARGQTMKAIEEEIARLEIERANIDGQIAAYRKALLFQDGHVSVPDVRKRARRGGLKETVLELAEEVGNTGMTAEGCVSLAKTKKGIDLVPGSVSSLLSRLKTDGVLFYDGQRYRLRQFAGPKNAA